MRTKLRYLSQHRYEVEYLYYMPTTSKADLIVEKAYLRIKLDTTPNMNGEEFHRILGALLDEVAFAYALLSPNCQLVPALTSSRYGALQN